MKDEEIKIIAEYMGAKEIPNPTGYDSLDSLTWFRYNDLNLETRDFKFHSSWDWLMKVVEKIEETGAYKVEIRKGWMHGEKKYICHIYSSTDFPDKVEFQTDISRISAVYYAVLSFIKTYNKIKK